MPLRSIVAVVLRLFAVAWTVQAAGLFCAMLVSLEDCFHHPVNFWNFSGAVLFFACSVIFWLVAYPFANFVCRGDASIVNMGGLTRRDLYAFACVLVGLHLSLSSCGQTLNWIHYFLSVAAEGTSRPLQMQSGYAVSKNLVDFAAGLALLLFADRWASLLVQRDERR